MPRYFFDICYGSTFARDPTGSECDGMVAVRDEAVRALPAIARDEIPRGGDRQAFTVLVRDENDITVYTATLMFTGLWIGDSPLPEPEEEPLG
ncbi:hypothetical protein CIW48_03040 [Methylobacterium sp. P1-11]|uniref:DUF6894 family protein n=1 Tax=Methylobacterium sp. P1-11 TaxID=2024616 RepID=UPI0011ED41B2|nr:hypothetical protein [Methylobacterium sp. P1-11]KAA0125323.1 hypothetical protein CIW48_03040 [Methylobacterium sp. P1-11]